LLLPFTAFGWLNITPRVGGRYTYYGQTTGADTFSDGVNQFTFDNEPNRFVFDTGAEVSTKASRTWAGVKNRFFDLDGVRHIVQPLINYSYIPTPNVRPPRIPQFDYLLPSEELLPITFPEYNSIDFIDRANVLRLALRNRLQTKRRGQIENVVNWALQTGGSTLCRERARFRMFTRNSTSSHGTGCCSVPTSPTTWMPPRGTR
jgi:hypothetical protein